jgi:phage RecT family recombinase
MTNLPAKNQNLVAFKQGMMAQRDTLSMLIPDTKKQEKFIAAAAVIIADDKLSQLPAQSLINCCMGIAMLDLNPNPLFGLAHIVPYKSEGIAVAQLQIGYKGWNQLLSRAGFRCKATVVYSCDIFERSSDGFNDTVKFIPNDEQRTLDNNAWVYDNLKGVFVTAINDLGVKYTLYVSKREIEKLRKCSPFNKADKPSGVWEKWYEKMAIAKAIKALIKTMPISDEKVLTAISVDDMADIGHEVGFKETAYTGVIHEKEIKPQPEAIMQQPQLQNPITTSIQQILLAVRYCDNCKTNLAGAHYLMANGYSFADDAAYYAFLTNFPAKTTMQGGISLKIYPNLFDFYLRYFSNIVFNSKEEIQPKIKHRLKLSNIDFESLETEADFFAKFYAQWEKKTQQPQQHTSQYSSFIDWAINGEMDLEAALESAKVNNITFPTEADYNSFVSEFNSKSKT